MVRARTEDVQGDGRSWEHLMLPAPLIKSLTQAGFPHPSPVQQQSIPLGRIGADLIVQAKSGTGKTVAFAVICLERIKLSINAPQALILAPTREIAVQSEQVLTQLASQLPAPAPVCAVFVGGLPVLDDEKRLRRLCHMAVGTPGRVAALVQSGALTVEEISVFVLDEADSLLGDSFYEDVTWVYDQLPRKKQVLAFSATYSEELLADLEPLMKKPQRVMMCEDTVSLLGVRQFYHLLPTLQNADAQNDSLTGTSGEDASALFTRKVYELMQLLSGVSFHQAAVFCNTKVHAEWLAQALSMAGYPAAYLAAGVEQTERMKAMAAVKDFKLRVVVSTDVLARGVDLARVNLVALLDLPRDAATYMHRIGRTGRFGSRGVAVSYVTPTELELLRQYVAEARGGDVEPLPAVLPPELYDFEPANAADAEALAALRAAAAAAPLAAGAAGAADRSPAAAAAALPPLPPTAAEAAAEKAREKERVRELRREQKEADKQAKHQTLLQEYWDKKEQQWQQQQWQSVDAADGGISEVQRQQAWLAWWQIQHQQHQYAHPSQKWHSSHQQQHPHQNTSSYHQQPYWPLHHAPVASCHAAFSHDATPPRAWPYQQSGTGYSEQQRLQAWQLYYQQQADAASAAEYQQQHCATMTADTAPTYAAALAVAAAGRTGHPAPGDTWWDYQHITQRQAVQTASPTWTVQRPSHIPGATGAAASSNAGGMHTIVSDGDELYDQQQDDLHRGSDEDDEVGLDVLVGQPLGSPLLHMKTPGASAAAGIASKYPKDPAGELELPNGCAVTQHKVCLSVGSRYAPIGSSGVVNSGVLTGAEAADAQGDEATGGIRLAVAATDLNDAAADGGQEDGEAKEDQEAEEEVEEEEGSEVPEDGELDTHAAGLLDGLHLGNWPAEQDYPQPGDGAETAHHFVPHRSPAAAAQVPGPESSQHPPAATLVGAPFHQAAAAATSTNWAYPIHLGASYAQPPLSSANPGHPSYPTFPAHPSYPSFPAHYHDPSSSADPYRIASWAHAQPAPPCMQCAARCPSCVAATLHEFLAEYGSWRKQYSNWQAECAAWQANNDLAARWQEHRQQCGQPQPKAYQQ